MNLNNLNLVELNAQDVQEVEGGFIMQILPFLIIGGVFGLGFYNGYNS